MKTSTSLTLDKSTIQTQAIIFIGPSAIMMMVSEQSEGKARIVDLLTQPFPLARDIFRLGRISRHTMDRSVAVLDDFMSMLSEYKIGTEMKMRIVVTNIVLEAENVDSFMNRIHVAHGLRIHAIDDGEMTRLIYQRVKATLAQYPDLEKKKTLVAHVGPGNTRILLFDQGRIVRYSSYRLGSHRTAETLGEIEFGDGTTELSLLREHVRGQMDQIKLDYGSFKGLDSMIVMSQEVQQLGKQLDPSGQGRVTLKAFAQLSEEMAQYSLEQRMLTYEADFANVGSVLPALMVNALIAQTLELEDLIIPNSAYDTDFLVALSQGSTRSQDIENEVLRFAELLANRYHVDRNHRNQVSFLCDQLFAKLEKLHRLNAHDGLLLGVAAVLHEVGGFINQRGHHRHSQYIILNSEIFGLSRPDVEIVALLALYHRHGTPSIKDAFYAELDAEDRLRVQKLAALLRVADALDRPHAQRIKGIDLNLNGKALELTLHGVYDATVESMALKEKGELFTDIFGLDLRIENA